MSAETCPICGGAVMQRGGITIFQCGSGNCQHAAEVVEKLRAEKAELLEALKELHAEAEKWASVSAQEGQSHWQDDRIVLDIAQSAIAKADGKQ